MAANDYHVIVYQILAYLYAQLKKGEPIDAKLIANDSPLLDINYSYWAYIIKSMIDKSYISGVTASMFGKNLAITDLESCQITPDGIEFICDDYTMEKVRLFVNNRKDIPEFVANML